MITEMPVLLIFYVLLFGSAIEPGGSSYYSFVSEHIRNFVKCDLSQLTYTFFGSESSRLNYYHFSRDNPKQLCDLQPTKEALKKCKFDSDLDTYVLVHGWVDVLPPGSFNFIVKDELLGAGDFNVVVFNWTYFSNTYQYGNLGLALAALTTPYVGLKLSAWMRFLQNNAGANIQNFRIISHSLGATGVTNVAAKTTCDLGHITYLDPVAFRFLPFFLQPGYTDASFVDVIHTSSADSLNEGDSMLEPIGDIDYYPNGGNHQTQCYKGTTFLYVTGKNITVDSQSTYVSCNHDSVYPYYMESFHKDCQFLGLICDNYDDYLSGKCNSTNSSVCRMGFYSIKIPDLLPLSKCYFKTSAHPPYCLN